MDVDSGSGGGNAGGKEEDGSGGLRPQGCARVQTEVACALSWFSNWSHDQRKTFTDKLMAGLAPEDAADQLLRDLEGLDLNRAAPGCPSVFQCQLRIFDGWFRGWSQSDKMEFVRQICIKNDL